MATGCSTNKTVPLWDYGELGLNDMKLYRDQRIINPLLKSGYVNMKLSLSQCQE